MALGGSGSFVCRRLEFMQASDLFEVDTVPASSRRVATASKRWVFENSSLELSEHIIWERAVRRPLRGVRRLLAQGHAAV